VTNLEREGGAVLVEHLLKWIQNGAGFQL